MKFLAILFFSVSSFAGYNGSSLQLLKEIVEINSGTFNLEGQEQVRQRLIPEFTALGFQSTILPLAKDRKLLVFDFPGAKPKLLFVGHIDTVFEKFSPFKEFKVDGDLIKGPGVGDMKAGLVTMLDVLKGISNREALKGIRIVINDDEETGSAESEKKMQELAENINTILIFEPSSEGKINISHPGVVWLKLSVTGKGSHAGSDPKQGINACVELSRKIDAIAKLGDDSKNILVNPGVIEGGTKPNIICASAAVTFDIRYIDPKHKEQVLKSIEKIANKSFVYNSFLKQGTTSKLEKLADVKSMPTSSTKDLAKKYIDLAKSKGLKIDGEHVGGVASYGLALPGKKVLNGLGPVATGTHTVEESLSIPRSEEKTPITISFVESLLLEK